MHTNSNNNNNNTSMHVLAEWRREAIPLEIEDLLIQSPWSSNKLPLYVTMPFSPRSPTKVKVEFKTIGTASQLGAVNRALCDTAPIFYCNPDLPLPIPTPTSASSCKMACKVWIGSTTAAISSGYTYSMPLALACICWDTWYAKRSSLTFALLPPHISHSMPPCGLKSSDRHDIIFPSSKA